MLVFTWLIFVINPIIGIPFVLLGFKSDKKKYSHYSCMLALLFGSFAYWFIPNHEMDLTRYFDILNIYSHLSWSDFVNLRLTNNILFVQELFFYVIAKTNNFHLLPAVSVFIVYFITFFIISDYSYREKINPKRFYMVLLITVLLLPFPTIVSNIRNVVAFSIFTLAVYRDLVIGKRNMWTICLYILPCFLHISTVALLVIRILARFSKLRNKKTLVVYGLMLTITFTFGFISDILSNSFFMNNALISNFINKADYYISDNTSAYAQHLKNSVFLQLQKYYYVAFVLFLTTIIILSAKKMKNIELNKKYLDFFVLSCILMLSTSTIVLTVYMRFTIPIIMMFFFIYYISTTIFKKGMVKLLIQISLFIFSIGGLLQQIALLNELTNLVNMITSVMIRSLIFMFMKS